MDLIQLNKFADLHNGKDVIFSKTEYLKVEFKKIQKIKNEVILISGNSDEGIDAKLISYMPDNVLVWYCQNDLHYHDKLKSIPIGLENTIPNKRKGHGIAWPHAVQKIQLINELISSDNKALPTKFMYSNFNEQTNVLHRAPIRDLCIQSPFINWDEPSLKYNEFLVKILDHEAIVCPAGNGIDSHRLYEILYCGRIPVTIKTGDYPLYSQIYANLPVVILDAIDDLKDEEKLKEMIAAVKKRSTQYELLDYNYWQQQIASISDMIVKNDTSLLSKFLNYIN